MVGEDLEFSIDEFAKELETLLKEVKSEGIKVGLLDRATRGDRRRFDFTGASIFFKRYFPKLERLYNQVRNQGVSSGYIQD